MHVECNNLISSGNIFIKYCSFMDHITMPVDNTLQQTPLIIKFKPDILKKLTVFLIFIIPFKT